MYRFSATVAVADTTKRCRFNRRIRCWWFSCSRIEPVSGIVVLCVYYRGGDFLTPRKVVVDLRSCSHG